MKGSSNIDYSNRKDAGKSKTQQIFVEGTEDFEDMNIV